MLTVLFPISTALSILQRVFHQMVSKAALKSIKLRCRAIFHSLALSITFITKNITSTVPQPGRKPFCDSFVFSSIPSLILLNSNLKNIFRGVYNSAIPR